MTARILLAAESTVSIGCLSGPSGALHKRGPKLFFHAILSIAALLPAIRTSAVADTVELSGGGHIASDTVRSNESEGQRAYVAAKLDDDIWVQVPRSRVRRLLASRELGEYRQLAAAAAAQGDADAHYELARWCKAQRSLPLEEQYRFHLSRAVELDPNHSRARAALGYVEHEGSWIKIAELQRSRGLVSVKGRWVLPEAASMDRAQEDAERSAKHWAKEIVRLRKMVLRGNEDAFAELAGIDDPLASFGVARELAESRGNESQSRQLRKLWVDLLGKFRTSTSVEALVLAALKENDPVIRDLAINQLHDYGASSAIATLMPMLRSNNKRDVRAAAAALTRFPAQPWRAFDYIDALVTTHKKIIPPGPGTQVGFDNFGGGGLKTGGKPVEITERQQNPDVLSLLKEIEPDVDYGFNESRWKLHFAEKWASYNGELRRDP